MPERLVRDLLDGAAVDLREMLPGDVSGMELDVVVVRYLRLGHGPVPDCGGTTICPVRSGTRSAQFTQCDTSAMPMLCGQ